MSTHEPRCPALHDDLPYSRCALDERHAGTHRNFAGFEWGGAPDLMDGGVTCAAIENETDAHRDDADNARTMAALWKETAREHIGRAEVYQEWMHAAQGKAEKSRPLTADDITDEMIERGVAQWMHERLMLWDLTTETVRNNVRESVLGVLTAALTPEPQRPEGAEEIERLLTEDLGDFSPPATPEAIADLLAVRGVRVTTKENR